MPKRILSQCGVSSKMFIGLIVPTTCSSVRWDARRRHGNSGAHPVFKGRGIFAASGGPLTFFFNLHLNKKKNRIFLDKCQMTRK